MALRAERVKQKARPAMPLGFFGQPLFYMKNVMRLTHPTG